MRGERHGARERVLSRSLQWCHRGSAWHGDCRWCSNSHRSAWSLWLAPHSSWLVPHSSWLAPRSLSLGRCSSPVRPPDRWLAPRLLATPLHCCRASWTCSHCRALQELLYNPSSHWRWRYVGLWEPSAAVDVRGGKVDAWGGGPPLLSQDRGGWSGAGQPWGLVGVCQGLRAWPTYGWSSAWSGHGKCDWVRAMLFGLGRFLADRTVQGQSSRTEWKTYPHYIYPNYNI